MLYVVCASSVRLVRVFRDIWCANAIATHTARLCLSTAVQYASYLCSLHKPQYACFPLLSLTLTVRFYAICMGLCVCVSHTVVRPNVCVHQTMCGCMFAFDVSIQSSRKRRGENTRYTLDSKQSTSFALCVATWMKWNSYVFVWRIHKKKTEQLLMN